jgi:hypothetical protein
MNDKNNIFEEFIRLSDFIELITKNTITINIVNKIKVEWEELFKLQLKEWGFNDIASNELFEWGNRGHNWDRLHSTEEEDKLSISECLLQFSGEIYYCSDRMSLDRLFRCHWLYNHAIIQFKNKNIPVYEYNGIIFTGNDCFESDKENISYQRLLCEDCAKKYKGNDLVEIEEDYWKNNNCSICRNKKSSYFMRFEDFSLVKRIK